VLGAVLVLFGVGWLLESLDVDVPWDVVFPAVLIGIGVMLVVSARSGAGQVGLILAGIVLTVLLVLGTAIDIPFGGGVGDRSVHPMGVRVEREYERGIGTLTLDLTDLDLDAIEVPFDLRAGVGIGELVVIVPEGAAVRVETHAGLGTFGWTAWRKRGSTRSSRCRLRAPPGSVSKRRSASGRCGSSLSDPGLNRSAVVAGVFFIAAGAVFLLERLGVWDVSLRVLGPVLLITLGIAIILGGRASRPPP
jgi:hypothetical protein